MVKIAPSILSANFADLGRDIENFSGRISQKYVQLRLL